MRALLSPLELSPQQIEALRQLANLGSSDAARSLGRLLGTSVEAVQPRAQVAPRGAAHRVLQADGAAFSVHFTVDGGARMRWMMHVTQEGAQLMGGLLLGSPHFRHKPQGGEIAPEAAARRIAELPVQQVGDFAQLDGERALRMGVPEVIFGERKRPEQIGALVARLVSVGQAVLVTRMSPEAEAAALAAAPRGRYDPVSRTFSAPPAAGTPTRGGLVAVVCAGTTDIPVAEEACATAHVVGAQVERVYDVGISG